MFLNQVYPFLNVNINLQTIVTREIVEERRGTVTALLLLEAPHQIIPTITPFSLKQFTKFYLTSL